MVQGTQEDPPKQMRDALKLAHVSVAAARHVILMTNDPELLAKMHSSQSCVHALSPENTVKLLEKVVQYLPALKEPQAALERQAEIDVCPESAA